MYRPYCPVLYCTVPVAVDLATVALHLDGDTGGRLGQPVLLVHPGAHLGCLAVLAGRGRRHLRLGVVGRSVGALEQRLVFTHHRQRFL